jgi:hypothetical protein
VTNSVTKVNRKILDGLKLEQLYLRSFAGQINLDSISKTTRVLAVTVSETAEFKSKPNKRVEITHKWNIFANDKRSKSQCLKLSVTYCLILSSKERFTKAFFEFYKESLLPINMWPFVREFVNNMTARMNVPPLNLPFLTGR